MSNKIDPSDDLSGSTWKSRDGKRAVTVLHEASPFCGGRMFMVRGTESGREWVISSSGLRRKYRREEKS